MMCVDVAVGCRGPETVEKQRLPGAPLQTHLHGRRKGGLWGGVVCPVLSPSYSPLPFSASSV